MILVIVFLILYLFTIYLIIRGIWISFKTIEFYVDLKSYLHVNPDNNISKYLEEKEFLSLFMEYQNIMETYFDWNFYNFIKDKHLVNLIINFKLNEVKYDK